MEPPSANRKDNRAFPTTDWHRVAQISNPADEARDEALDFLARRYWMPVYAYLLRVCRNDSISEELTQDFFAYALANGTFGKARRDRGRFRSFLLTCLKHFVANRSRSLSAGTRRPHGGIDSLDDVLGAGTPLPSSLVDHEDAERIFHQTWVRELLRNTLRDFEQECMDRNKSAQYDLFYDWVVAPILDGAERPQLEVRAHAQQLTYKEATNQIITSKRGFIRVLKAEIARYAVSPEGVAIDEADVLAFLDGVHV